MKYRSEVGFQGYIPLYKGGHGHDDSWRSDISKAYTNGSIPRQYSFDTMYLLPTGLRSFQKKLWFLKTFEAPLIQFSKFDNFLWVCCFKNLSNFLPPFWKLYNPYCHNVTSFESWSYITFAKYYWLKSPLFQFTGILDR